MPQVLRTWVPASQKLARASQKSIHWCKKSFHVKKVIIDTDPGIDDAMAIMLALSAHRKQTVEVVAITLVGGNSDTDNAKVNILRVLETYGLEDEVYFTKHYYYNGTRFLTQLHL